MMKILNISHLWHAGVILSAFVAAVLFGSCENIMEDEGYCPTIYKVKFTYTMNILEVDAFAGKVGSVSLFVFDEQGRFVTVQTESSAALAADDYAMVLDLPAGTYDFIAWCGLKDNASFALDNAQSPLSKDDLVCRLQAVTRAGMLSQTSLAPLWHGRADRVVLREDLIGEEVVATIDLTKDTNTVRIILQHYKGRTLNADDFEFTISSDNGIMNWDNSLLPCEEIIYREWTKKSGEVTMPGEDEDSEEITSISSVIAEIDVARLLKEGHKPVLMVRQPDAEKTILRLPLIDVLLIAKGEARHKMSDQEYLDRQDEYNLIIFLNDENGWYVNGGIWVNSWHVMEHYPNV